MDLVRFYACEADPLRVALKLLLKARAQGQRVHVCAERSLLERLSAALWMREGFLAHAGPLAGEAVRARSPLVLSEQPPAAPVPLLLNLGVDLPEALPVQRLFELVGPGEAERAAGRQRFRQHLQRGLRPETVKVPA